MNDFNKIVKCMIFNLGFSKWELDIILEITDLIINLSILQRIDSEILVFIILKG